jgi:hypothetical protein
VKYPEGEQGALEGTGGGGGGDLTDFGGDLGDLGGALGDVGGDLVEQMWLPTSGSSLHLPLIQIRTPWQSSQVVQGLPQLPGEGGEPVLQQFPSVG